MRTANRVFSLFLIVVFVLGLFSFPQREVKAIPPTDLFFSEYVEGTGFDKALEIYNGTGAAIDLATGSYNIQQYSNGSTSATFTINLTGTIANNDVFVVTQGGASDALKALADFVYGTTSSTSFYNGDDAIVLRKGTIIIDVFGQIGYDPGTEWPGGGLDDTLRRKADICVGDSVSNDAFNASVEWDVFAVNTWDGLGSHTANCGPLPDTTPPILTITGAVADGTTAMAGNVTDGFTLVTDRLPAPEDHTIQFAAGSVSDEELADTYFGLYFDPTNSTVTAAELITYYTDRGTPSTPLDFLGYLSGAANSTNPFVYIKGNAADWSIALVDAAKHDLMATDVDMTVPDDFPLGTYTVTGQVTDVAGNLTTVTLKLIVAGPAVGPQLTITGFTDNDVPMDYTEDDGYILVTGDNPLAPDHLIQFADGTTSDVPLADDYFGLYLLSSTVTPEELTAYYNARFTDPTLFPFRDFLIGGIDGTNPFAYIKGSPITLVDAAKHFLLSEDADMTVPDNFPAGTYVVQGIIKDEEMDETTVTLKLTIVAPTDPRGVGLATPDSVMQGNKTLLTVTVTPGQYPTSTNLGVVCDLSPIGGSGIQALLDNGVAPDVTAGDNIFSYEANVGLSIATGPKVLSCVVDDAQMRLGFPEISLTVTQSACHALYQHTYEIQGSGLVSPWGIGSTVTVQGVVTGDFTGTTPGSTDFNAFYINDVNGDGDPLTSDGLMIYYSGTNPAIVVGDVVRVEGKVAEYQNVTEISSVSSVTNCGHSPTTISPVAIDLPLAEGTTFEPLEGMLVTFTDPLVVAQNYFLGRYGQMHLSLRRFFNPTNGQGDTKDEFLRSSIVLDDGNASQNPRPTPYIGDNNTVRAGDTVLAGLTGFMDEGAINSDTTIRGYRLQPVHSSVSITRTNDRPAAPTITGSTLKVVGYNVENYFTTLDVKPYTAPYDNSNTPRGADSAEEFTRQRNDLFAGLVALNPDVFGVTELEAWDAAAAPQDFVDGLNAAAGVSGEYAFIEDPATGVGSDYIQNGLFYKIGAVTPVGASMSSTDSIYKRAPIAQTFMDNNGNTFSVIVNHFKSKGSCPDPADPDYDLEKDNGQGCWNHTRTLEAQALLTFIEEVKTASGDPDVLVIGDLNSYGAEDPIIALTDGGLVNEMALVPAADRYSYVFDGFSGYLDHALSTSSLHTQIAGVKPWHANADEPSIIDYNVEYKYPIQTYYPDDLFAADGYRASDHDPIVIGLNLPTPVVTSISPNMKMAGSATFTITVTGLNFNSSSKVFWNGVELPTSYVSATRLVATVNSSFVTDIDIAEITVNDSDAELFYVYSFADVLPTHPLWRFVEGFFNKGLTTGCAINPLRYCPDRGVTRAEMAVFILRALHADDPTPYVPEDVEPDTFADVPVAGKAWMEPWIEQFAKLGLTTGCGTTSMGKLLYCPERGVTRAEMAVFLLRAKFGTAYVPMDEPDIFVDMPVPGKDWMEPWAEQFYKLGYTTGCGGTVPGSDLKYCPERGVNRAEMATFIVRVFEFPQMPDLP